MHSSSTWQVTVGDVANNDPIVKLKIGQKNLPVLGAVVGITVVESQSL